MAYKRTPLKRSIAMAALLIPLIAVAQSGMPPLKRGVYVATPFACKGAPNAAIMDWDGTGFSGAHSTRCTTHVLSSAGTTYKVSTKCLALGDGSPDLSGASATLTLKRRSMMSYSVQRQGEVSETDYRWCSKRSVD